MFKRLAILLILSPWLLASPTNLRVASLGIAPLYFPSQAEHAGLCPDLFAALSELDAGLNFSGQEKVWSIPIQANAIRKGQLDIICPAGPKPPYLDQIELSEPIFYYNQTVAQYINDPSNVQSMAELAALSQATPVAVVRGSALARTLKAAGVRIDDSDSDIRAALHRLAQERGRFVYAWDVQFKLLISQLGLQKQLRISPYILSRDPGMLAISRRLDPQLRKRLLIALEQVRKSGKLAAILKKYEIQ